MHSQNELNKANWQEVPNVGHNALPETELENRESRDKVLIEGAQWHYRYGGHEGTVYWGEHQLSGLNEMK